jgi:hypothetical protein
MSRSRAVAAATAVITLLPLDPAVACTVCFGDPNSAETRGLRGAILFLLVLVGAVQIGFLKLFWTFRQRARSIDERKKRFQILRGGVRT